MRARNQILGMVWALSLFEYFDSTGEGVQLWPQQPAVWMWDVVRTMHVGVRVTGMADFSMAHAIHGAELLESSSPVLKARGWWVWGLYRVGAAAQESA